MALFGIQLVITMVMLSLLHKFSIYYSFARWLISYRLIHYSLPSEEKIKKSNEFLEKEFHNDNKISKNNKDKDRSIKRRRKNDKSNKDFQENTVSKQVQITLAADRINPLDLLNLPFYKEYQWLLDFAVCAFAVFFMSELHYFLMPFNKEMNLSLIWCSLVIAFALKLLLSLTNMYFGANDDAIGERSICIISGCLFFLLSMIVLIDDESFTEFGLHDAYHAFNKSATTYLAENGLQGVQGVFSQIVFKFWLAVCCGLVGAFLIFPGFRLAQMYIDSVSYAAGTKLKRLLLHVAFISPLLIILLWIRPVGRNYFTVKVWRNRGILMSSTTFEVVRIFIIVSIMLLRIAVMPWYLQAYLNIAPKKLGRLKKESGRIKTDDMQKIISGVYCYLCVVCLQYLCPLLICFFAGLLFKVLGGYSWLSLISTATSSEHLTLGQTMYRGIFGFISWWLVVVWFSSSLVGFIYHSYLSRDNETLMRK